MRRVLAGMAVLLCATGLCGREWTDSTGKFKVEAELKGVEKESAVLQKSDGTVIRVPLARLSAPDQEYVKRFAARTSADQGAGADSKPSAKPAGPGQPGIPASDAERIQGQWVCIDCSDDGKQIPNAQSIHAVFTDKEGKISGATGGLAFKYQLDATANPKRCDLLLLPLEATTLRAIYRFEDDALLLVLPTSSREHPTGFEAGKGRTTYLLRREMPATAAQAKPAPKPTSKQEAEALAGLQKDLAEAMRLLEAAKYREFIERFASPDDRKMMEQMPDGLEQSAQRMKQVGPVLAKLLRLLAAERPTFSPDFTSADYDVRKIHLDGLPPKPTLSFVKVGDRWYAKN